MNLMTNSIIINNPLNNNFSYQSRELSLVNELDELKDLRRRVDNYNQQENFHYMLKLLTGVKRGWF
jgi:hypothetical protein